MSCFYSTRSSDDYELGCAARDALRAVGSFDSETDGVPLR